MDFVTEIELAQTMGAGGSRARAEKEPEGPITGLWLGSQRQGEKAGWGPEPKVIEEC